MPGVKIRQLIDGLRAAGVKRLCDRRGVRSRPAEEARQSLARSYGGNHREFLGDLRQEDLARLLADPTVIGGREYHLPLASRYPKDDLLRIATVAFASDRMPAEFEPIDADDGEWDDDADDDDDTDDDTDDDDTDDDGGSDDDEDEPDPDDDDDGIDHYSDEYAEQFRADLRYSEEDAARKAARPYQTEAAKALLEKLHPEQPQILHLATGGGKTLVANNIVVEWLDRYGGPVLWVTKDWRLLYQGARDLRRRHKIPMPRRLGGDGSPLHPLTNGKSKGGVIYTTIHTLSRRLDQNVIRKVKPTLLVWDECHWGEHAGTGKILTACKRSKIPVLGLTATPREDTRYEVAYSKTYYQLVRDTFLAEERIEEAPTNVRWSPEYNRLGGRVGDVTQASLRELAANKRRNEFIVERFLDNAVRYRKTIVFACSVEHATTLAKLFTQRGVAARPIHHQQTDGQNQRALDDFRSGAVDVLVNVAMLTHGIDVPDARSVFLCRPTASEILFAQMIGRACRRDEGKTFYYVVDFTDNVQARGDMLKSAKVFFEAAGAGRREEPAMSRRPSGELPKVHAFDPTGMPTWIPNAEHVPENLRGLWYRQSQTFGVEIELTCDGPVPTRADAKWRRTAEELRERLAVALPLRVAKEVIAQYAGDGRVDKDTSVWNVEYDSSCGWEVTSRILKDHDGFCEIDDACRALDEAATDLGLGVDHRTGVHIHIGWLSGSVEELRRAVKLARLFEPALATLVAPSRIVQFEDKRYDLSMPNPYCNPVAAAFDLDTLERVGSFEDFAKVANGEGARYVTFNVKPLESIHTVEVRLHSGSLEARKILPWISLWQQILWAAANRRDVPDVDDCDVIVPNGDIIALASQYLPDARQLDQRAFIQRLATRRAEVVELWRRHPKFRPWTEFAEAWAPAPA